MKKFVNLKMGIIASIATLALGVILSVNAHKVSAELSSTHETIVFVNEGFTIPLTVTPVGESLSSDGAYRVSFRISEDWYRTQESAKNVSFNLFTEMHRCKEGNGNIQPQGWCGGNMGTNNQIITLNEANNYSHVVTFNTKQEPAMACGSFQTDLFGVANQGQDTLAWSIYRTGVNCPEVSPSPSPVVSPSPSPVVSPSPSPSVSPSASPSVSPSPSPTGGVSNSSTQNQNQEQTQNNSQNQTNNQNANATGGNSSSSSSSNSSVNLTINNPNPTPAPSASTTVVYTSTTTTPQVVTQVKGAVTELPKTGLPLAALALGGLLPGGMAFKRFGKKDQVEESANSIWIERQLNS